MKPANIIRKIINKANRIIAFHIEELIFILFKFGWTKKYSFESFATDLILFDKEDKYTEKLSILNKSDEILEDAARLLNMKFRLFSKDISFKNGIEWTSDFINKRKWPNRYIKNLKLMYLDDVSDVKVPWEFARLQFIPTLGKAYLISGDQKYYNFFKMVITDFMKKNRYMYSVNWYCAMEVAIRCINVIVGYRFFIQELDRDKDFNNEIVNLIYLHGKFIFSNLENKAQNKNNHYISDLVGLIWISLFFIKSNGKLEEPKSWLDFSLSEMEKEVKNQTNNDGTNYEASTMYHRLNTELFFLAYFILKQNNINVSDRYNELLEKMIEYIYIITKPNGQVPTIGDSDDARILIMSNYFSADPRDYRHLLAVYGALLSENRYINEGCGWEEEALWYSGKLIEPQNSNITKGAFSFPDGGCYIIRNDKVYLFIRCGSIGMNGGGNHSHNDQLSFELNINGIDIFIDPGTFTYTGNINKRNEYRCTAKHNSLALKGFEQNGFLENGNELFGFIHDTNSICSFFDPNIFVGVHRGFEGKCNVQYQRTIYISENSIWISDLINFDKENSKKNSMSILFTLAPAIEPRQIDAYNIELIDNGNVIKVKSEVMLIIKDVKYSNTYLNECNTKAIYINLNSNNALDSNVWISY